MTEYLTNTYQFFLDFYWLLYKVVIVIVLTDLMDLFCFRRKRGVGYFCIDPLKEHDGWHDFKKLFMFYIICELVEWNIILVVLGAILNWVMHEKLLYHGLFNKFDNH